MTYRSGIKSTCAYNSRNQLTRLTAGPGSGAPTASFQYDDSTWGTLRLAKSGQRNRLFETVGSSVVNRTISPSPSMVLGRRCWMAIMTQLFSVERLPWLGWEVCAGPDLYPGADLGILTLSFKILNSHCIYNRRVGMRGGGGQGAEERIPGVGGGRQGEMWVDITAEKGGTTLRVQTVDTPANWAPTPRELSAASRIRAAFPSDKLLLVPKADACGAVSTASPLFRGAEDDE